MIVRVSELKGFRVSGLKGFRFKGFQGSRLRFLTGDDGNDIALGHCHLVRLPVADRAVLSSAVGHRAAEPVGSARGQRVGGEAQPRLAPVRVADKASLEQTAQGNHCPRGGLGVAASPE